MEYVRDSRGRNTVGVNTDTLLMDPHLIPLALSTWSQHVLRINVYALRLYGR